MSQEQQDKLFAEANQKPRPEEYDRITDTDMTDPIMQHFEFRHLPPHLAAVSRHFYLLAAGVVTNVPKNPERDVALRKLLEAKDAAVRAMLHK